VGSSAKAEALLGWKPRYQRLETILSTAWNWHQSQR
jgi:UDP-glucose 4-epimerase